MGVGPFATADSTGQGGANHRVPTLFEKRAAKLEGRLAERPEDKRLLLAVMRAWMAAGSDQVSEVRFSGKPFPSAVSEDFESGLRAWNRYLQRTGGKASVEIAEQAGGAFFDLVEIGSEDPAQATANAAGAVRALRIACRQKGELFNLSNLAIYEYFNGEMAAGDKTAGEAAASVAHQKGEGAITPAEVIEQLDEYKARGEKFVQRVKRGTRALEESGEEELEAPIKGYGSPAGINGYEPGTGPNEPPS